MSLGKILCLHGFVQNGSLFARKSSGVRKALKKIGYDTVYLTGPVTVSIADLPFDVNVNSLGGESTDNTDSMRSWWPNSESAADYYKLDQAFDEVAKCIEENGPFVGVLGFSQGGGLAGILCQMIQDLHPKQDPLKFGIFYSGFRVKPDEHQHFYNNKISTPTLHIIGSLDTVVSEERVMWLYNSCSENTRTKLVHPGGHFVPNGKDMVNKLIGWVQALDKPVEEEEKKENGQNEWDEFDKIGAF